MTAKRSIEVSTDVFAMIWSCRRAGEEAENDILHRILQETLGISRAGDFESDAEMIQSRNRRVISQSGPSSESLEVKNSEEGPAELNPCLEKEMTSYGKIRWVDDVRESLRAIGGRGPLSSIYKEVEKRRKAGNRTVPKTLEATIRRTLEDHSSDSANFRGEDLFANIGRGEWALRR